MKYFKYKITTRYLGMFGGKMLENKLNQKDWKMRVKEVVKEGLFYLVIVSVAGSFCVSAIRNGAHERAWRAAAKLADKKGDNNGVVSEEEYTSIYRSLGLEIPNPAWLENRGYVGYALELSDEQLKTYVRKSQ